jgi:hypothetical protein
LRGEVADQLTARMQADQAAGRPALDPTGQRVLAGQLIVDLLDREAKAALTAGRPVLTPSEEEQVTQAIQDLLFGLGRLQRLLDDPEIENINANGCDRAWVRYADGRRVQVDPIADSDGELVELIRLAAARLGLGERRFDLASSLLDLRLPDGSRLFAAMAVVTRPCLAVRLHRYPTLTLDDLASNGTIDRALQAFLAAAVRARLNLIVSGGTSAGKTTLLRALAAEIPFDERLVTIEEAQVRCTGSKLRPSSSTSPCATRTLSVPGKVAWQLERGSVGLPTSSHQCTCRGVAVCQHRGPDRTRSDGCQLRRLGDTPDRPPPAGRPRASHAGRRRSRAGTSRSPCGAPTRPPPRRRRPRAPGP